MAAKKIENMTLEELQQCKEDTEKVIADAKSKLIDVDNMLNVKLLESLDKENKELKEELEKLKKQNNTQPNNPQTQGVKEEKKDIPKKGVGLNFN